MSKMIEIDFDPADATLRQFGWVALVGFEVLAALAWFEVAIFAFGLGSARPWVSAIFGGFAALAACFSLVWPRGNKPIFVGLSVVTFPIGFVLSYLILGSVFYLLIAPVAIVFRVVGRDPMHRRFDPEAESYWSEPRPRRPNEAYFRQY